MGIITACMFETDKFMGIVPIQIWQIDNGCEHHRGIKFRVFEMVAMV